MHIHDTGTNSSYVLLLVQRFCSKSERSKPAAVLQVLDESLHPKPVPSDIHVSADQYLG